jgi:hypothetical protein
MPRRDPRDRIDGPPLVMPGRGATRERHRQRWMVALALLALGAFGVYWAFTHAGVGRNRVRGAAFGTTLAGGTRLTRGVPHHRSTPIGGEWTASEQV